MNRPELHLVSTNQKPEDSLLVLAVEKAFSWAVRRFPQVDTALIANWAEEVFHHMQASDSHIDRPISCANVALRGKVLSWMRLAASNVHLAGAGRDLERIGGQSSSFQGQVERSILFDQLELSLEERDRYILTLLRDDKSTVEIAAAVHISDPAARKAVQRVKERIATILLGTKEMDRPEMVSEAKG